MADPLTTEEREAVKRRLNDGAMAWAAAVASLGYSPCDPEDTRRFASHIIARLAAGAGEREAERPFVARHSAQSEVDADEVAQKLFDHYGDEAQVEVCRKLTSDPTDEQVWSVLCTRWSATPPDGGTKP